MCELAQESLGSDGNILGGFDMSKILDAFKNVIFNGYEDVDDDNYSDDDYDEYEEVATPSRNHSDLHVSSAMPKRPEKAKVIPINGGEYIEDKIKTQLVKAVPKCFEDVAKYADLLNEGKVIIINFEELEREVAQRIMDFIGGASHILGGSIEKIANNVYAIAPENAEFIVNAIKEDPATKTHIFSWATASR